MSESRLSKQFTERDLQRARNLISGNSADNTRIQVGYQKQSGVYSEGDIWEENGKRWTIKNGLKQTLTKHDKIREIVTMPLKCPSCNNPLKPTPLNKKMWSYHKQCSNCVIDMETQLRINGGYEEYAKNIMNSNKTSFITDYEQAIEEYTTTTDDTFVSEAGDIENWSKSKVSPEVLKMLKDNIKKLKAIEL